jgi:penicillin amidase
MQLDDRNGFASALVPHLLRIQLDTRYDRRAQRLFVGWDYTQPSDSAAAAYFNAVWRQTLSLTFHDDLPESQWPSRGSRWYAVMERLLDQPASPWWDDRRTEDETETRDDILKAAMLDARDDLVRRQDREPERWTWGHQHVLNLTHQTVGSGDSAIANLLLNRGGFEVGGGDSVLNATAFDAVEDYEVVWAPSMRMLVSLGDLDESRWVNLTGASGHAYHDHYVDQTELWLDGRTLPFRFSRAAVDSAAEDRLSLQPGRTS